MSIFRQFLLEYLTNSLNFEKSEFWSRLSSEKTTKSAYKKYLSTELLTLLKKEAIYVDGSNYNYQQRINLLMFMFDNLGESQRRNLIYDHLSFQVSVCDLDQSKTHFQTITSVGHKAGSCVSFATKVQVLKSPGQNSNTPGRSGSILLRLACAVGRGGPSGSPRIQQVSRLSTAVHDLFSINYRQMV